MKELSLQGSTTAKRRASRLPSGHKSIHAALFFWGNYFLKCSHLLETTFPQLLPDCHPKHVRATSEPHPNHIRTTSKPHQKQWQKLREKWFLAYSLNLFRGVDFYFIQFEQVKCTLSGSYTVTVFFFIQKNPRAHKKIGTPPPKKNPPKRMNFMDMGFFLQKERIFQAPIKLAQPFPAPELRTRILRTRGFF